MMLGKETSRLKGLYLFWNQVDKRETSGLYEKYGQVVADMGPVWVADFCGRLGIRRKDCGFDSTRVRAYRVGRETVHDYVGMRVGKTVFCSAIAIFAQGQGESCPEREPI